MGSRDDAAHAALQAAREHAGDTAAAIETAEAALNDTPPLGPPAITPTFLSANHSKGRGGQLPVAVVIHISEGSLSSMTSWFRNPASKVSAHYGIGRDGTILQYVRDEDTAWHAGLVVRPTAALVLERAGVSPNSWSIGVEHEGYATEEPTAEQLRSSARLLLLLADRHTIPLDRRYVIGHREIRGDKTCPGKIDVGGLVRMAREMRG